jgi:hypothetical protein
MNRVTTVNYNFNVARQDVNQFGRLAALSREIIQQPTVGLTFEYHDYNAHNENALGFVIDHSVSALSGIINGSTDERNFFMLVAPNDEDAVGNTSADTEFAVVGIGNCFVNNYQARGAVGGLPSVSVGAEGLNFKVDLNRTGSLIPAVNPVNGVAIAGITYDVPIPTTGLGAAALRPGDITVTITADANTQTGVGVSVEDAKIQSYDISVPLARTPLNKLGSRFSFAQKLNFPITATAAVAMQIGDYQTGALSTLLCNDNTYTVSVSLREPSFAGSGPVAKMYTLKNCKLASQDFSNAIGANSAVTMNFETQIAGGEDTSNGFFCSGLNP